MADIVAATRDYESWLGRQVTPVREDFRYKHERMAEDAFSFFRATFYRWAQRFPRECPGLRDAPRVLAVGDTHVENFGTWRDAEARLIWGVNDFDEAHPLPYTNDLVRLAVSAGFAIAAHNLDIGLDAACDGILSGYADYLESGGIPFVLEEDNRRLRKAVYGREREPVRFWGRLEALPTRKRTPRDVEKLLREALPSGFSEMRVAHRRAGLGSLGRPRYTALAKSGGAWVAREAKALAPSACVWAAGLDSTAILYGELEASAVRVRDPFTVVTGNRILRRLSPHCCRIDLADMDAGGDAKKLLRAMGRELANIHLGSRSAVPSVAADLAKRPDGWLRGAADAMTAALLRDFEDWRRAHRG